MKKALLCFYLCLLPFVGKATEVKQLAGTTTALQDNLLAQYADDSPIAQDSIKGPGSSLLVNFGLKAGLNYSNTNFNKAVPKPSVPVASTGKAGIVAGMVLEIHLSDKISVQQEYLYSEFGGGKKSNQQAYYFSYASLPVLVKYKPVYKIGFTAGLQFDLLIKAEEILNSKKTTITYETEERSVGFNTGLEYTLAKYVVLNIRYIHGYNHIGIWRSSPIREEFKFETLQLSLELRM